MNVYFCQCGKKQPTVIYKYTCQWKWNTEIPFAKATSLFGESLDRSYYCTVTLPFHTYSIQSPFILINFFISKFLFTLDSNIY